MPTRFIAAGARSKVASGNAAGVALPTGWTIDDILLLLWESADNVVATVPAAWTKRIEVNSGTTSRFSFAWTRATSGLTAPTVTHASGSSIIAFIAAYRGAVRSGDPFGASNNQANASSVTVTAPTITPLLPNQTVIFVGGTGGSSTSTPESFSGYSGTVPTFTQRVSDETGLGTLEVGIFLADGIDTTGAATGSRTATAAAAATNVGALLAFTDEARNPARNMGQAVNRAANF